MSDWMKVQRPHDALPDDGWDYHEWVYLGERLLLDVLGRPNPRVWGSPSWQRWVCNNPDCHGSVVVHEEYVKALIDAIVPVPPPVPVVDAAVSAVSGGQERLTKEQQG